MHLAPATCKIPVCRGYTGGNVHSSKRGIGLRALCEGSHVRDFFGILRHGKKMKVTIFIIPPVGVVAPTCVNVAETLL